MNVSRAFREDGDKDVDEKGQGFLEGAGETETAPSWICGGGVIEVDASNDETGYGACVGGCEERKGDCPSQVAAGEVLVVGGGRGDESGGNKVDRWSGFLGRGRRCHWVHYWDMAREVRTVIRRYV